MTSVIPVQCFTIFLFDCIRRLCFMPKLNLPHYMLVRLCSYSVLLDDIIRILHKDFQSSQSSSNSNTRSCSTTSEPTKCTEHRTIQKGSALWMQLALFVCYLPYCIVVIFTAFSKISQTHLAVSGTLTLILVSFNSTLNPFLYCWKISEVSRQ